MYLLMEYHQVTNSVNVTAVNIVEQGTSAQETVTGIVHCITNPNHFTLFTYSNIIINLICCWYYSNINVLRKKILL